MNMDKSEQENYNFTLNEILKKFGIKGKVAYASLGEGSASVSHGSAALYIEVEKKKK